MNKIQILNIFIYNSYFDVHIANLTISKEIVYLRKINCWCKVDFSRINNCLWWSDYEPIMFCHNQNSNKLLSQNASTLKFATLIKAIPVTVVQWFISALNCNSMFKAAAVGIMILDSEFY